MSKTLSFTKTCPNCRATISIFVKQDDVGKTIQGECQGCHRKYDIFIPSRWASKFDSDPTIGGNEAELSVMLEIVPDAFAEFQRFELTSDYYTIGRKNNSGPEYQPDVEVVTVDKKMSRKHAAIRKKGKTGFTLKDIGGKNGVYLNGRKLKADDEFYLSDGDMICLGETKIQVTIVEHLTEKDF